MVNTGLISQDRTSRLRILIADDIQETRRSTRLILAMNPDVEVVAIARDGQQAIDMAEIHKPDIAILDINMPKVDGISAFSIMRQTNPDIACIIISTEQDNQTLRKAMSVGAREYLVKPFTVDELNMAIRQVSQIVLGKRKKTASVTQVRKQREAYLKQLAREYAKSRRSDDQALEVFENLAANPECELRWLKILAMIFVIRQKWGKLRVLTEQLEQREPEAKKNRV